LKQRNKKLNTALKARLVIVFALCLVVFTSLFTGTSYAGWIEDLRDDFLDCWTCEIAASSINIMGHVAFKAAETLFDASYKLLGVGIALWLAFMTMNMMNPFTPMNIWVYLKEVSNRLFAALCVAAFFGAFGAGSPNDMYDLVADPLVDLAQELSLNLIFSDLAGGVPARIDAIANRVVPLGGGVGNNPIGDAQSFAYISDNVFDVEDVQSAVKLFSSVIIRLSQSMVQGLAIVSGSLADTEADLLSKLQELICGVLIVIPYVILLFVSHMVLADMYIRIAVFGALFPLMLVAWVFPVTRRMYTMQAFAALVNTCVIFLFLGLFIGLLSAVVENSLTLVLPGVPALLDPNTLALTANVPDPVTASAALANPNDDALYVAIVLPWLMLFSFKVIYSWGDKFTEANLGDGAAIMAGSALASMVTPKKTFQKIVSRPQSASEYDDPLSSQIDAEGDGI
jgi:hypothetical protein